MASRLATRLQVITQAFWHGARTLGRRHAPTQPQRILIAHHLLLGDTLMLTPLLAKLRQQYPKAELVMATPKAIASLYAARPYGVVAVPFDPHDRRTLAALRRRGGYDLAIVPGDNRFSWLALALGARWIVAFAGDRPAYKNWPVDALLPYPNKAAAWGDMVATLVPGVAPQAYRASDWPAPAHRTFDLPKTPYCILHVGASTPLKQWPPERWATLATHMKAKGFNVIWSGGKGESALVDDADPAHLHRSFAGQLDLPQLWHLIRHAALLVCPDTGVAHMGRLTGTPTLTLFGPGSETICGAGDFWRDAPYRALMVQDVACRDQRILFRREIEWVRRCGRSTAECATPICMQAITTESVISAAEQLLQIQRVPTPPRRTCYQYNFSTSLGGAEVYVQFFSKALQANGWDTVLFVNEKASFWQQLNLAGVTLAPIKHKEDMAAYLPPERSLLVTHTPLPPSLTNTLRAQHTVTGIIHHPIYGGNGEPYRTYDLVFPVSRHVIDTLENANMHNYYPEPLYGVADLDRLAHSAGQAIEARPMFDWDKRKLRDRVLRIAHPLYWAIKPAHRFQRKPGLTLGIVSRIADAKQFPALFKAIAPIIKRHSDVHVEIFGSSVGYASYKRLKRALKPIQHQVRFWGPQSDLRQIYGSMDFLLAGLPEREAMGLNLLEAQFCGTPVLAVNARPFSEIVKDGETGYLYTDPRLDKGAAFKALIEKLLASGERLQPLNHPEFLVTFKIELFSLRIERILSALWDNLETAQAPHLQN